MAKKSAKGQEITYRLVHDLRAINKIIVSDTLLVPNPHTILASIPPNAACFSVVDLSNAFFSVPLDPQCQYLFAFTFQGRQYTWTRLPQGSMTSPSEYSCKLKVVLDQWVPEDPEVSLLQYVDDLLVCCPDKESCYRHTISLLNHLASTGNKASKEKLQFCMDKVTFLGHCISKGTRHLTTQRIQTLKDFTRPRNARQLRALLGLIKL